MSENKQIDLLQYMLMDVRKETLKGIGHLTKDQLFTPPQGSEYPVGAYLMHLGEVDLFWLGVLSEGKVEITDEMKKRVYSDVWFDPYKKSAPPAEAPEVDEYLMATKEARDLVLDYLEQMEDWELEQDVNLKGKVGKEYKMSKKWIVYHLIEHEAHHRGQMLMLIRMAGWKKPPQS